MPRSMLPGSVVVLAREERVEAGREGWRVRDRLGWVEGGRATLGVVWEGEGLRGRSWASIIGGGSGWVAGEV